MRSTGLTPQLASRRFPGIWRRFVASSTLHWGATSTALQSIQPLFWRMTRTVPLAVLARATAPEAAGVEPGAGAAELLAQSLLALRPRPPVYRRLPSHGRGSCGHACAGCSRRRRIGELHGGTATATSIQSGTSFNLTLPLVAREM